MAQNNNVFGSFIEFLKSASIVDRITVISTIVGVFWFGITLSQAKSDLDSLKAGQEKLEKTLLQVQIDVGVLLKLSQSNIDTKINPQKGVSK